MTMFSTALRELVVEPDELIALAGIAAGRQSIDAAPEGLIDAGVADGDRLDPLAAAMAATAVDPDRAVHLDRIAGEFHHALWVGWERDGRATMSSYDSGGEVVLTGTQMSLLPVLLMQWLGLRPRPELAGRRAIDVTRVELETRAASTDADTPTDQLDEILASNLSWKVFGAWRGGYVDAEIAVVDGGTTGLWRVLRGSELGGDDSTIRFVPIDVTQAVDRLGDVVTGRAIDDATFAEGSTIAP